MIDLSHLTEDEQGMIMTVLNRDSELKKAEDARISKLQRLKRKGSQAESTLKFLTGEWFYEAKSRRHRDKIHGSEIILASMKQRRAGNLEGSFRFERQRSASGRGSDLVPPPKPARCLESSMKPPEASVLDSEKERLNLVLRSPARSRHNPFNRASQILVDEPEKTEKLVTKGNQESVKSFETEPISPLKNYAAGPVSLTPAGSVTSEASSAGFRPVPKKRTFLSRRPGSLSDSSSQNSQHGSNINGSTTFIQHGLGSVSNQPSQGAVGEQSQKTTIPTRSLSKNALSEDPVHGQILSTVDQVSQKPLNDITPRSSNTTMERDRKPPSSTREGILDSPDSSFYMPSMKASTPEIEADLSIKHKSGAFSSAKPVNTTIQSKRERSEGSDGLNQRESMERSDASFSVSMPSVLATTTADLKSQVTGKHMESPAPVLQDEEKTWTHNLRKAAAKEDPSLIEDSVAEPVVYDLNYRDNHELKKASWIRASKTSPQSPRPTGEEGDSIAKVLEWFSRSTDSNDWLDMDDSPQDDIHVDRQEDMPVVEGMRKDSEERLSEEKAPEIKIEAKRDEESMGNSKSMAVGRNENKHTKEREEKLKNVAGAHVEPEVRENEYQDENYSPKISHLKSFWEKGNTGPKILISRSNTSANKEQGPAHEILDKEKEKQQNERHKTFDIPETNTITVQNSYSMEEKHETHFFDLRDVTETAPNTLSNQDQAKSGNDNLQSVVKSIPKQQGIYTPEKRSSLTVDAELHSAPASRENRESPVDKRRNKQPSTDLLLLPEPPSIDRTDSDSEIQALTRQSTTFQMAFQSRLPPEPQRFSPLSPKFDPISRHAPPPVNPSSLTPSLATGPENDELTRPLPSSQLATHLQTRDSPDSDKLFQSRYSPPMGDVSGGAETVPFTPQIITLSAPIDNLMERDEQRSVQPSVSPKQQQEFTNKERNGSLPAKRPAPQRQESTAERIKQLRSFWEQEKSRPIVYTGKPKGPGDGRVNRESTSNLAKMNKRFTKSEFDLSSIANDLCSDREDTDENRPNYNVIHLNQGKSSPGAHRAQFKNLREFWGEATSPTHRGSLSFEKPKSPKKREATSSQPPVFELKQSVEPDYFGNPMPAQVGKSSAVLKSSLPPQNQEKLSNVRQVEAVSKTGNYTKTCISHHVTVESKDSFREEKATKPRSPKTRKGNSIALRRATSMFSLNVAEEKDKVFPGNLKKVQEAGPALAQGRRQSADSRLQSRGVDQGAGSKRYTEDSESFMPRARAFVPRDYRHYLGITESSVHTSLAPTVSQQGSDVKTRHNLDLSGPARASTPVGSDESFGKRGSKVTQRPLWVNHSGSDTGRASSVSSTSDTWSSSRNSSTRENNQDDNVVRRALRRAEARPKNLAKSLEDITASLSPRQETRHDHIADLRRGSDVSSICSPSSSLSSDADHLKKMSKSVPSFLHKENGERDTDSASEGSSHGGMQNTGRSMTLLSTSSGMASASSLSGSVMTVYNADLGNVEVQGTIQFSINYVLKLREFHIFVSQCQGLATADLKRRRSDPYVKSYLVPDKANLGKRKTSVKKKTQNPSFKEILRYRVRMEYLRTKTLILSVWHHDTFGKNSFLGEVDVDLSKWDFDRTQMNDLALKARPTSNLQPSDDRGEMRVAIRFLPRVSHSEGMAKEGHNTGEVHIWVKDCRNLPLVRGATIDPYVKCFVLPDTSRKSRQKTRVLRRTVDPVFNHTLVYDGFRQDDLTEACVELTVWDRDRLGSNLLGGLRLGPGTGKSYGAVVDWMDSTMYEVALWERMMASPNEWVEEVLPLRMLTTAKITLK